MDATALLLSRIQFGFTISFHIIFPAFTIGLAAWLTVLEAMHMRTGRPVYQALFEFWLKIFGVAFGMGVVSGVVMGFRNELERPRKDVRADPGAASLLRNLHGIHAGSQLLRSARFRTQAGAAVVLSVRHRDGVARDHVVCVLDHDQ